MFGVSHALSFTANYPTATRSAGALSSPHNLGAVSRTALGSNERVFSNIRPLAQQNVAQHSRQLAFVPGLASGLRNSSGGKDLRAMAFNSADNKMAFAPSAEGFIPEPNFIFYADVQTEGQWNMPADEQPETPVRPSQPQSAELISIESDTADNNTRVMISIDEGLKGRPLADIASALTDHLGAASEGLSNLHVAVTEKLSPSVVVAEISAGWKECSEQVSPGFAKKPVERPLEDQKGSSAGAAVRGENPFRATLTAAVNCLQRCRGVVAIEADHKVTQR